MTQAGVADLASDGETLLYAVVRQPLITVINMQRAKMKLKH